MDTYHLWFDVKEGVRDLDLCQDLAAFLDHLRDGGAIIDYRLQRRKLGFGPPELGEFHLSIEVRDLAQLDQAFGEVAPRSGEVETLHAKVWSKVANFRSGLFRDYPDPERVAGPD